MEEKQDLPKIQITDDGSHTLFHKEFNQTYHSRHGAIQEAYHVFLKSGFNLQQSKNQISILEIGFGTGLNTFITYLESLESGQKINYYGIEKHPLNKEIWEELNFPNELQESNSIFHLMHEIEWNKPVSLTNNFTLTKYEGDLETFEIPIKVDLIYFDAFSPSSQPMLWTKSIFTKMYNTLNTNGILVTYSCKGDVRRAMIAAGFNIEKIPGPPGKREMLRGIKC